LVAGSTICKELSCPQGMYRDDNLKNCQMCDPTCLTCKGGLKSDCEACSIDRAEYEELCYLCKDIPGFYDDIGFKLAKGYCPEICGDGLDFGQYQCDDGNTISGDGCSKECKLERYWSCTGGDPN